jgi:hypothetical protein
LLILANIPLRDNDIVTIRHPQAGVRNWAFADDSRAIAQDSKQNQFLVLGAQPSLASQSSDL